MSRKKEFAIYRRVDVAVVNGKWAKQVSEHLVQVMARANGYAMVRNPGCYPFVVSEKDLAAPTAQQEPSRE